MVAPLEPHFRLSENPEEINVVIASCDRAFGYRKLNIGFQALKQGACFWATNADPTWPQTGGEIPNAGALIQPDHVLESIAELPRLVITLEEE